MKTCRCCGFQTRKLKSLKTCPRCGEASWKIPEPRRPPVKELSWHPLIRRLQEDDV
jgi:Zn finger protein HypA/HybF involved in hydrogenase expression